MGRIVTFGSQEHTKVVACDERGPGNANHVYEINRVDPTLCGEEHGFATVAQRIIFQNGPIKEVGVNGIQNEDLLVIVIDRLSGFQTGDYECWENQDALKHLRDALKVLNERTDGRKARGVEGTSEK